MFPFQYYSNLNSDMIFYIREQSVIILLIQKHNYNLFLRVQMDIILHI